MPAVSHTGNSILNKTSTPQELSLVEYTTQYTLYHNRNGKGRRCSLRVTFTLLGESQNSSRLGLDGEGQLAQQSGKERAVQARDQTFKNR